MADSKLYSFTGSMKYPVSNAPSSWDTIFQEVCEFCDVESSKYSFEQFGAIFRCCGACREKLEKIYGAESFKANTMKAVYITGSA